MLKPLTPEFKARATTNLTELRDLLTEVINGMAAGNTPDVKLRSVQNKAQIVALDAQALADEASGLVTQREEIWKQISNPRDWKGPINEVIIAAAKDLAADAIRFYTATEPTFETVKGKPAYLRVKSPGYRMGPAGP